MSEEVQQHVRQKFVMGKKVGSGAYGHVWKVTARRTGNVLALKKIFDAFQHAVDAQRTYRQIVYLHQLQHPNIIRLHEVIRADNDKDLYLVFQFMEADLHNAISQRILRDAHHRHIIYQLTKALNYLHSAAILHRDLKPSNLLLNSDCHVKVCDFGLARSFSHDTPEQDVVLTEEVATRWYRAPQVLLGSHEYSTPADVWSAGCILAEMLLSKPIFPGSSTLNQLERIVAYTGQPSKQDVEALHSDVAATMLATLTPKPRQENFGKAPAQAIDLLNRMLQFNPNKRISVGEILAHPYLAQCRKPTLEIQCNRTIFPPVSDNKKLNLKQYKQLIYERIRQLYQESERKSSALTLKPHTLQSKDKEWIKAEREASKEQQKDWRKGVVKEWSKDNKERQWSKEMVRDKQSLVKNKEWSKENKELVRDKQWLTKDKEWSKEKYNKNCKFGQTQKQQQSIVRRNGPTKCVSSHTINNYMSMNSCVKDQDKERMRRKQSLKDLLKNKREKDKSDIRGDVRSYVSLFNKYSKANLKEHKFTLYTNNRA